MISLYRVWVSPGETKEMMLDSVRYLNALPVSGIKLQLLHILNHTDLADCYERTGFHVLTPEEYTDLVSQDVWLWQGLRSLGELRLPGKLFPRSPGGRKCWCRPDSPCLEHQKTPGSEQYP
mgnify:CR=1 FL=1